MTNNLDSSAVSNLRDKIKPWFDWIWNRGPLYPIQWLGGFDLEALPFHKQRSGQAVLTFLATFLAAQGAALGIAAKGKATSFFLIILFFYCALIFLAAWGIVAILRLTQPLTADAELGHEPGRDAQQNLKMRAYDRATISFGRWSLIAAFTVWSILAWSAYLGILPGQEPERIAFVEDEVLVSTQHVYQRSPRNIQWEDSTLVRDQKRLDKWIEWMHGGVPVSHEMKFLWIEQVQPFDRRYDSFRAELTFDVDQSEFDAIAFLLSNDESGRYRPIYRQLAMDQIEKHGAPANGSQFLIANPNPGERLVLIVKIDSQPGKPLPTDTHKFGTKVKILSK